MNKEGIVLTCVSAIVGLMFVGIACYAAGFKKMFGWLITSDHSS
jgi:hypothetical protein